MWAELLILCGVIASCLSEYCTERYSTYAGYSTRTIHCSFGCCGSFYDQYCCVSNAGFIVGLIFAGIFAVSIGTALVCCCLKHKTARGRIIQPSSIANNSAHRHPTTQNNVFIVPTAPPAYSAASQPPNYGYPYPGAQQSGPTGPLPPAYSSAMPPPPAYTYTSPAAVAFPPPPPSTSQQQPSPFAIAAASSSNQQQKP